MNWTPPGWGKQREGSELLETSFFMPQTTSDNRKGKEDALGGRRDKGRAY